LLGYGFVGEQDASRMAPILDAVKRQLTEAQRELALTLEPPTRAAGRL
jgi:hypothetical protein